MGWRLCRPQPCTVLTVLGFFWGGAQRKPESSYLVRGDWVSELDLCRPNHSAQEKALATFHSQLTAGAPSEAPGQCPPL